MEYQIAETLITITVSSLTVILTIAIGLLTFFVAFRWEQIKQAATIEAELDQKSRECAKIVDEATQDIEAIYETAVNERPTNVFLSLVLAMLSQPFVWSYLKKVHRLENVVRNPSLARALVKLKPFRWLYLRKEERVTGKFLFMFPTMDDLVSEEIFSKVATEQFIGEEDLKSEVSRELLILQIWTWFRVHEWYNLGLGADSETDVIPYIKIKRPAERPIHIEWSIPIAKYPPEVRQVFDNFKQTALSDKDKEALDKIKVSHGSRVQQLITEVQGTREQLSQLSCFVSSAGRKFTKRLFVPLVACCIAGILWSLYTVQSLVPSGAVAISKVYVAIGSLLVVLGILLVFAWKVTRSL